MKRRAFLGAALTGGAALIVARNSSARQSRTVNSRIEVLIDEPVGRIAPEIYGHFAEHLGGVVYDSIWVGENSKIPNFWVDAWEWPKDAPDGPWKYDTNHFGTDEFLRFCQLAGAPPYLAVNLRSLTARDFYEWVDYCNSPAGSTTLADMRAAAGQREPYKVQYWGVGNESWGCGGTSRPKSTQRNIAASSNGFRNTGWTCHISARARTEATWRGRGGSSAGWPSAEPSVECGAGGCTIIPGTSAPGAPANGGWAKARPCAIPTTSGSSCSTRRTAWRR
jgi:hypothetical protein